MKVKSYMLIYAIVLGSGFLFSVPTMANYHCVGNNISVVIERTIKGASYTGKTKSGQIYLGADKLVAYEEKYFKWDNNGYIYKVLHNKDFKPYRLRVYKPNGRRIVNKRLRCRWMDY